MKKGTRNHYHTRNAGSSGGSSAMAPEFPLHWGNRRRLRCVKFHDDDSGGAANDVSTAPAAAGTTVRAYRRRVARAERNPNPNALVVASTNDRQRILRYSEVATRANANEELTSSDKAEKDGGTGGASTSTNVENDKVNGGGGGGSRGSSSGSEGTMWPNFAIALSNKEKEEDFLIFKGSKLPQRPKKRTKLIQKTLNMVSPGTWLCDLTLERYEVREKETLKKKPRGLKAMGSMEGDSE